MTDTPNAVDVRVGATIRQLRKAHGFSQERLSDAIGVSFQQLQKYERGFNRVSASRLEAIARVLDEPVSAFFHDGRREQPDGSFLSAQATIIAKLIEDLPPHQRHVVEQLVRTMRGPPADEPSSEPVPA